MIKLKNLISESTWDRKFGEPLPTISDVMEKHNCDCGGSCCGITEDVKHITRAKKLAYISFSMNRFYQGDWIDSMASRFIEELPEKNLKKNTFYEEKDNVDNDFEFNQDFELEENTRSPGWMRYQKRIK